MLMLQKTDFIFMLAHARWPVMVLAAFWLGGCAMAPGFSVGRGLQKTSQQAHLEAGTSPTGGTSENQTPTSGILLAITPQLITQQRALRKAELSTGVKRLLAQTQPQPYGIGPGDVINIVVWNHPELVLAPAGATLTT